MLLSDNNITLKYSLRDNVTKLTFGTNTYANSDCLFAFVDITWINNSFECIKRLTDIMTYVHSNGTLHGLHFIMGLVSK